MKFCLLFKLILGFVALTFGFIGLFLPVWPTTPFVLLAMGCFSTTPAIQSRLLNISFFREYYENYTTGGGLSKRTVASSLVFLWGMLLLSALWIRRPALWLLLLAVGAAVTAHILWVGRKR